MFWRGWWGGFGRGLGGCAEVAATAREPGAEWFDRLAMAAGCGEVQERSGSGHCNGVAGLTHLVYILSTAEARLGHL